MNKQQTEHLIWLVLGVVALTFGIISVYCFAIGIYPPILYSGLFLLMLLVGTVLAIAMGGMTVIMSIFEINEARYS